ncbi:MAG: hypothetical protein HXS47_11645 [Theionarchaea archaeon]|nr:hypothetical protein [Theionarchaea archaeon]
MNTSKITQVNPSVNYIFAGAGTASTTDAILVFLFPVLLLTYYDIPLAQVTLIFTAMRVISPIFTYMAGHLVDTQNKKILIIALYSCAVLPILILIAAYLVQDPAIQVGLSFASGIIIALVFSSTLVQEPYIVENSTHPQKSLMKFYSIGFTCLFLGSIGMTIYFTFVEVVLPLLVIKSITDFCALFLVLYGLLKRDSPLPIHPVEEPDTSHTPSLRDHIPLILSLITFSLMLALLSYYASYYVPIMVNERFLEMSIVSASFVFINGANGLVNFVLAKKFPKVMPASVTYVLVLLSAGLFVSFYKFTGSLGIFSIWLALYSLVYAVVLTYGKINMLLISPPRIKGRVRAILQALMNIFAGILAYAFLQFFNNDPRSVGLVAGIIVVVTGTVCTIIVLSRRSSS